MDPISQPQNPTPQPQGPIPSPNFNVNNQTPNPTPTTQPNPEPPVQNPNPAQPQPTTQVPVQTPQPPTTTQEDYLPPRQAPRYDERTDPEDMFQPIEEKGPPLPPEASAKGGEPPLNQNLTEPAPSAEEMADQLMAEPQPTPANQSYSGSATPEAIATTATIASSATEPAGEAIPINNLPPSNPSSPLSAPATPMAKTDQLPANRVSSDYTSQPDYHPNNIPRPPVYKPVNYVEPPKPKSKKPLWFTLIGIIIVAISFYFLYYSKGSLALTVNPTDATVTLDNQPYKASQQISPGSHQLQITKTDYFDYQKNIIIKRGLATKISVKLIAYPQAVSLISGDAKFITTAKAGQTIMYLGDQGTTIYQVGIEINNNENQAKPKAITSGDLAGVQNIIWHPDKNLALVQVKKNGANLDNSPFVAPNEPDGTLLTFLFSFVSENAQDQSATLFSDKITSVAWFADGQKVLYVTVDGDKKSLVQADAKNTNQQVLADFSSFANPKIVLADDGATVLIVPQATDSSTNNLYSFDINKKEMSKLSTNGNITDAKFTSNSQILYSQRASDSAPNLYLVDRDGKNNRKLNFGTYLDKLVFGIGDQSNLIIFAAISSGKSDQFKNYDLTSDQTANYIYKDNDQTIQNATNLILSSDNKTVFFVDQNNKLYQLGLETGKYE